MWGDMGEMREIRGDMGRFFAMSRSGHRGLGLGLGLGLG